MFAATAAGEFMKLANHLQPIVIDHTRTLLIYPGAFCLSVFLLRLFVSLNVFQ